jgi:DNA-binding response OmpR family regulator
MSAFPHDTSYCDLNQQRLGSPLTPSSVARVASPTVLIVDDDSVFRQLEARVLCEQGYNVLQADCADEALRLAGATPTLHLLLTDFNMPGVDGVELAQQFRTLRPETPVLMVSGSLPLMEHKVKDLDRFAVLEKSSSFEELLEKVRTLLAEVTPLPFPGNDNDERNPKSKVRDPKPEK